MAARKRITAKQRVARRRNIAIARMHKESRSKRKIDKAVNKYVDYFNEERPSKPPLKKTVFRTMKKEELSSIKKGKKSGEFWTSDPSEYGRHAVGRIGEKGSSKVLVAAKSSGRNKSYRGLHGGSDRHFQEINKKTKKSILGVYEWNGTKMVRKKR